MTELPPKLSGYRFTEKLYASAKTQVFRALQDDPPQPVIVKFLNSDYPSFHALTRFRNQYTITKNLPLAGVVRPLALEKYQHGYAMVMVDTGSIDLPCYLQTQPLSIAEFFDFAIAMADILQGLYQNRVLHKDIKPANILIQPETKRIHLIDFGSASLLPREMQSLEAVHVLQGTLAYMSPEQTGRMNRGLDHRTDLYALGVSCYEILTGRLPFLADDPMELVHSHLAKPPTPPKVLNNKIPQAINDLILKLMAKTMEERYQSAAGLKEDLCEMQKAWAAHQRIALFPLGRQDFAERFQVSDKLYGRKQEIVTLLTAFDRVSEGASEMLLVVGFSGIGKTALINEVHQPMTRQRGYFVKGKFDQYKRDIPFSALVQALQRLLRQLRNEAPLRLAQWKAQWLSVLADNGQVLIDVIPELEQIIGAQPSAVPLEGHAEKHRFHRLFQLFIQVLAAHDHPLVIFLDDLQWIDAATLQLLPLLMQPKQSRYLLLIGAYRDNEVTEAHSLLLTLETMRKEVVIKQITLAPLTAVALNQFVAESLHCPRQNAWPLTQIVLQKTQGNPFYSHQFLKLLYEDGLITFAVTQGYWSAEMAKIQPLINGDEDVVDLMTQQIRKLCNKTQEILSLAACIGNQFDLSTVSLISERSSVEAATDLWPALQEGLIVPLNEGYKFFQETPLLTLGQDDACYRFLHDRVQQAAYALIPDNQKGAAHLKIGCLLKQRVNTERDQTRLFDLVNQLNAGMALMVHQHERDELARLNYSAGKKALAVAAYVAAKQYFSAALTLLAKQSWQTDYTFTLNLHNVAIESAYLNGDYGQQEQWSAYVLAHTRHLLDAITAHHVKCMCLITQSQFLDAIDYTLPILEKLGVDFIKNPTMADFQQALAKTQNALANRSIGALSALPEMTNATALAALQLIEELMPAVYFAEPQMEFLVTAKAVQLLLKHGNAPAAPFLYAFYGMLLLNHQYGAIEDGHEFGLLALQMIPPSQKSYVYGVIFSGIKPWIAPLAETLDPLVQAYQCGIEIGDFVNAGLDAVWYCVHAYYIGDELSVLEPKISAFIESIVNMRLEMFSEDYLRIVHQTVLNLLARSNNVCTLQGMAYCAADNVQKYQAKNDRYALCTLNLNKLILKYLFREYADIIAVAQLAEQYLDGATSTISEAIFYFYDALARLAVYPEQTTSEQTAILEKVTANQKKLQHWAKHAPMNFQHKWELVHAEQQRVCGDTLAAQASYDRAIAGAKEQHYMQEEALANELAGRFYLASKQPRFAQMYLTDAYYAYARWGAKAKVLDLETCYPTLLAMVGAATPEGAPADALDVHTIMKSSRALSSELTLTVLLQKMLDIVMESAGAQRSVLLLNDEQCWSIAGERSSHSESQPLLLENALESYAELPHSVIDYAINKQQPVVLDDARDSHQRFYQDPYFHRKPELKSVLCLLIRSQAKVIGLLYLENTLVVGAFPDHRLEMLEMLAAQAAISVENAILYENLESLVEERTKKLENANAQLQQTLDHLKNTQQQLIEAEMMAGLGTLVAGVAHEINTPIGLSLTGVSCIQEKTQSVRDKLQTHVLKQSELEDMLQDIGVLSNTIYSSLDKAAQLVRYFKQIAVDQHDEQPHDFNVHDYLNNVILNVRSQFEHLRFSVDNRVDASLWICSYAHVFAQIFTHLIINSCTHGFDHKDMGCIIITGLQRDNTLHLRYEDNGKGIDQTILPKIFDPFFTTTRGQGGSGLGLHIIYNLITQILMGRIWCNSTAGEGVVFTIEIPIKGEKGL